MQSTRCEDEVTRTANLCPSQGSGPESLPPTARPTPPPKPALHARAEDAGIRLARGWTRHSVGEAPVVTGREPCAHSRGHSLESSQDAGPVGVAGRRRWGDGESENDP